MNEDVIAREGAKLSETAVAAGETIVAEASSFINWMRQFVTWGTLFRLLAALVVVLVLRGLYKLARHEVKKVPPEKLSAQRSMLIQKALKYTYYVVLVLSVLSIFGIKFSAIWGAAGIAGVAIGFAAQTSVSNLISGIFVLTEGALKVGDTIIIDDITGVVDSVNLLSVRVHTFDNQMVRIPNSTVLNENLINNSYFPVRRMTVTVPVSYKADPEKTLATLETAAASCPHVLSDPAPAITFSGFGKTGMEVVVAVWFNPVDFRTVKNEVFVAVKNALDEAGIEIPFSKVEVNLTNG